MKASSQKTFEMLGGGQGGQRERKRAAACWFPCDRHKSNSKTSFWAAFFVCLLDFVDCLLVGWDLRGVLQRFPLTSNVLFIFPAAIRPAWSENLYIAHRAIYSYRVASVCSSDGISYASSKILLLHAPPCPGLSQPLLLLSNQPHCCSWP